MLAKERHSRGSTI